MSDYSPDPILHSEAPHAPAIGFDVGASAVGGINQAGVVALSSLYVGIRPIPHLAIGGVFTAPFMRVGGDGDDSCRSTGVCNRDFVHVGGYVEGHAAPKGSFDPWMRLGMGAAFAGGNGAVPAFALDAGGDFRFHSMALGPQLSMFRLRGVTTVGLGLHFGLQW